MWMSEGGGGVSACVLPLQILQPTEASVVM